MVRTNGHNSHAGRRRHRESSTGHCKNSSNLSRGDGSPGASERSGFKRSVACPRSFDIALPQIVASSGWRFATCSYLRAARSITAEQSEAFRLGQG